MVNSARGTFGCGARQLPAVRVRELGRLAMHRRLTKQPTLAKLPPCAEARKYDLMLTQPCMPPASTPLLSLKKAHQVAQMGTPQFLFSTQADCLTHAIIMYHLPHGCHSLASRRKAVYLPSSTLLPSWLIYSPTPCAVNVRRCGTGSWPGIELTAPQLSTSSLLLLLLRSGWRLCCAVFCARASAACCNLTE